MGSINFNVDSVSMEQVLNELDIDQKLGPAATRALTAGAEVVLREAQALAPVRTGQLKGALKVGKRSRARSRYEIEVGAFYNDATHAHLVEHGHGGPKAAAAHPFLEPAVNATADEVTEIIMRELVGSL